MCILQKDNVPPGTVLGRAGVNPEFKEFVLQPQRAILVSVTIDCVTIDTRRVSVSQGTGRPTRYVVVHETKTQDTEQWMVRERS